MKVKLTVSAQYFRRVKEVVAESQRLLGKEHFDSATIAERQVRRISLARALCSFTTLTRQLSKSALQYILSWDIRTKL